MAWKDEVRLLRAGDLSVVRVLRLPPLPADADDSEQPDDATVEEPAGE